MSSAKKNDNGEIITTTTYYTLSEICEICDVQAELIIELVQNGVLEPYGETIKSWQFSDNELQRSQKALRLQRDLELNYSGIALILDLVEEVEKSHQQIQQLQHLLKLFNIL